MTRLTRFGYKIALPSTRQIRHELLQVVREDERRKTLNSDAPNAPARIDDTGAAAASV